MKLPEFGVTRPIATSMLFVMVLVLGVICFSKLGVDLTPEIEPTRVTVMTTWEGASAEDVESKVTRVLEKRLGSVSNLDEIRSTTREGVSNISCTFTWGTNIDEAALLAALESGKVRSAGLDVWAEEPSKNEALYNHSMVSCTPHIGASTVEAQKRIGAEIVDIVNKFFA